jgi:hypothetical protein
LQHFLKDFFSKNLRKFSFILLLNLIILFFSRQDNTEPQLQKEILEKLDFSTLNWKLVGVNLPQSLRKILENL